MGPLFLSLLAFASAAAPFKASIGASVAWLTNEAPSSYVVDFHLKNIAAENITVLKWGTPLDKSNDVLRADMFEIVTELGVPAVYTGIVMKRFPTPADFVTLQPGETVSAQVDLLKGYWFPQEDKFFISLKSSVKVLMGDFCPKVLAARGLSTFTTFDLEPSEVLPVSVLDVIAAPVWGAAPMSTGVTPNSNCPSSNASSIQTANTNALNYTNRVNSYLTKTCPTSTTSNWVVWMGVCDSTRYTNVTKHFTNIKSRIDAGYRVDCNGSSCSANVYAYVSPNDSTFTVYVCGAYWKASITACGTWDTQPGTLIHELSHFTSVAATQDYQYGTSGCQQLAKTDPAKACNNADSHEYLAEGCPQ